MRGKSVESIRVAAGLAASFGLQAAAWATVTPGTLFGDSYVVSDGARTYAVLDVYIQCGTSKDILSGTFGVTAWTSSYTLNNGKTFQQSNGTAAGSWLPSNDDGKAWDSFVTCGARVQGSDATLAGGKAGFLGLQLDANWSTTSNGARIVGTAGGAGWYPSIGASSASNPYCRGGYGGGTAGTSGYWNTARCTSSIPGNGIVPGQSLSNYWMVGRFTIDVTGDMATSNTLAMNFAVAGRNYATETSTSYTTFTGATAAAGRFSSTLRFAQGYCPWPACPGDQDEDREVNLGDFSLVLLDFGPCPGCGSDLDGNGFVDMADASLVLLDFGSCSPCPCGVGLCQ